MFQISIKILREDLHLSQAELAEKLQLSQGTIGMWESGKRKPDFKTLLKTADFFNVSLDVLVYGNQKNTQENVISQLFDQLNQLQQAQTIGFMKGLLNSQSEKTQEKSKSNKLA